MAMHSPSHFRDVLDLRYTIPRIHLVIQNEHITYIPLHCFAAEFRRLRVPFMLAAFLLQQATPATMHHHPPGQGQGCWPHPHALETPQLV